MFDGLVFFLYSLWIYIDRCSTEDNHFPLRLRNLWINPAIKLINVWNEFDRFDPRKCKFCHFPYRINNVFYTLFSSCSLSRQGELQKILLYGPWILVRAQRRIWGLKFSHSVMSDSLRPHGLQHTRHPCPSPTPRGYPNSCPLSQWCHLNISSSVIPFFTCLQSFSASGSFPMSQLFASSGQSIGVSASTSVLPMNSQDWSSLGWTGWISLQSEGLSRVFSNTTGRKYQLFSAQLYL